MIGDLSYQEMLSLVKRLENSSSKIREVISKYSKDQLNEIYNFCDTVDAYSRFLTTYVELYQDSDEALKFMVEKNKQSVV